MNILLIEDHPQLSKNISDFLHLEKFQVETVRDGKSGLEKAQTGNFDLILLDLTLPLLDGIEICRTLREERNAIPILMLTARGDLSDKVEGLNAGADDYLQKPFEFPELLARVRALLRRGSVQKSEIVTFHDIEINFSTHSVKKSGKEIKLSPKEFDILTYLVRHQKFPKNRTEILEAVWGAAEEEKLFSSETVEVHIATLRKKLGKEVIETVRGVGYRIA